MIGYNLVQYQGQTYSDGSPKLITLRIEQAMAKLEAALNYTAGSLDLPQGCHHDGSLSGGTHSRADVFDLSYSNADQKAAALIGLGVVPFVRDYDWDGAGGMAHIHCLLMGSQNLSPEAAAQIPDWEAHKNGLANHAPYTGHPWGTVGNFDYQPHWTRAAAPHEPGLLPLLHAAYAAKNYAAQAHKDHPNQPPLAKAAADFAADWNAIQTIVYPD